VLERSGKVLKVGQDVSLRGPNGGDIIFYYIKIIGKKKEGPYGDIHFNCWILPFGQAMESAAEDGVPRKELQAIESPAGNSRRWSSPDAATPTNCPLLMPAHSFLFL
jgi:hypothetical protein